MNRILQLVAAIWARLRDSLVGLPETRFLIVGNGRTGSSWLLTSLDRLPYVNARHELKWLTEHYKLDARAHFPLDSTTPVSAAIETVTLDPDAPAVIRGSKLIFDPYWYYAPEVFKALEGTLGEARPILLKRNYLDIWLSSTARGFYHDVDTEIAPVDAAYNPVLVATGSAKAPDPVTLVLHHDGAALSDAEGVPYPLETAIDDLIQMFVNDIQSLSLVRKREGLVVDYKDIGTRLAEIAAYIGARPNDRVISAIVARPSTRKLPSLSGFLHPAELLEKVASALDAAFAAAVDSQEDTEVVQWLDTANIRIIAPGFADAVSSLGFDRNDEEIRWTLRRPVVS
jgi:hypothetical protein